VTRIQSDVTGQTLITLIDLHLKCAAYSKISKLAVKKNLKANESGIFAQVSGDFIPPEVRFSSYNFLGYFLPKSKRRFIVLFGRGCCDCKCHNVKHSATANSPSPGAKGSASDLRTLADCRAKVEAASQTLSTGEIVITKIYCTENENDKVLAMAAKK